MLSTLKYKWRRFKRKNQPSPWFSRSRKVLLWSFRALLLFLVIDTFYLFHIWPDWQSFNKGTIKKSNFIKNYQVQYRQQNNLPPLYWRPVTLNNIPHRLRHAVIVAEDARFYSHNGFDVFAFQEAMQSNLEKGRFKYGGSTISQQTVKNMFFNSSRNPLRKWHELIFTIGMEFNDSKDRIIETYLNVAEFGKGIYGVEAAARSYWNIPVNRLTTQQAIELAATLPSPVKHNPHTRTRTFLRRIKKISAYMY